MDVVALVKEHLLSNAEVRVLSPLAEGEDRHVLREGTGRGRCG